MRALIDIMQSQKHALVENIFNEHNFKITDDLKDKPIDQNQMITEIIEEKFVKLEKAQDEKST